MFAVGVGVSVLMFPCDDFHGTKPQYMNPLVNRRFLHVGTGPVMIHDDIMIIVVKRIHVYNIILISTEKKSSVKSILFNVVCCVFSLFFDTQKRTFTTKFLFYGCWQPTFRCITATYPKSKNRKKLKSFRTGWLWLSWDSRLASDRKVAGSNPSPWLSWAACWSVLEQETKPQIVGTLHGGLCHQWGPCDELATCPLSTRKKKQKPATP